MMWRTMSVQFVSAFLVVLFCSMSFGQQVSIIPIDESEDAKLLLRAGTFDTRALPSIPVGMMTGFEAGRRFVMQLDGPITPQRREAMRSSGVSIGSYLPNHAYIVELSAALPSDLDQLGFVQWIGEYQDSWKIDPQIGLRTAPFATAERIAIEKQGLLVLAVTLHEGHALVDATASLSQLGGNVLESEMVGEQGVVILTASADLVSRLAGESYVQYIEEAGEVSLRNSTDRWIVQSNVSNVTPLYNAGITGTGQIVGIIDGKINVNHCSFFDTDPIGPLHRKIEAYNSTLGSDFHGTHVAGTAVGDNSVNDNTRGVAYEGRLVYNTIPSFTESMVNSRLTTHHNQGARIHTNSWGDDGTTAYNGLCRGIDVFQRNNEDSLVLFAVTNLSTLKNPENAKNLLAVGASQDTPSQANHCSGGAGPTSDQRRKPEIYAPGCNTQSSSGSCSTAASTGTSMASPAVAGAGMLVRQYYEDGYYPSGTANSPDAFIPTAALTKATLLNASVDMTGIGGYPSNQEGWGRVLLDDALYFPGDTRTLLVLADVRNADGLSTGGFTSYDFQVTGSTQKLKVTLVWTDVAATAGAANATVNDLDLEVTSSASQLYLGNVFSAGTSVTGGTRDAKNNVEQVHLNNPPTGGWTVVVRATAVPQSTQGYALIVSGEVATGPDPTCDDMIQNQGEDLIDCGGPCPPCDCLSNEECDDGVFCTGVEVCTEVGRCSTPPDPCAGTGTPICVEIESRCVECLDVSNCDDSDACTTDECDVVSGDCRHTTLTILFGDPDHSGVIDVDDISCILDAFFELSLCPDADLAPCGGNGVLDVDDVAAQLDAFAGLPACADPCP